MILKAFAVYDEKAAAFMPPFFMATRGTAVRSFADVARDSSHEIHKHAGDYSLYEIGEYDQRSGKFEPVIPAVIVRADQLLEGDVLDALASR